MTLGPYQSTCVRMYTNQLIEECVMAQRTQAVTEDNDRRISHRVSEEPLRHSDRRLNHRVLKEPLRRSERRQLAVTLARSPDNTGQDQLDYKNKRPVLGESERDRTSMMT